MTHFTKLLIAVVMVAGCNSSDTSTTASVFDTSRTANTDTTAQPVIETDGSNYSNIDSLPADSIARLIMSGKLRPSDNTYTFRMMDSMASDNLATRQFYFPVFNKIMDHADGALGEAIGDYAVTYVEQHPKEFIENIQTLPPIRMYTWASNVGIELFLASNQPNDSYNAFSKAVVDNCKGCNAATLRQLKRFNQEVWKTMQENTRSEKDQEG